MCQTVLRSDAGHWNEDDTKKWIENTQTKCYRSKSKNKLLEKAVFKLSENLASLLISKPSNIEIILFILGSGAFMVKTELVYSFSATLLAQWLQIKTRIKGY